MSNSYTLYKRLFISEADTTLIRSNAVDIISRDPSHSIPNAYIEATLAYLDSKNMLSIEHLDADSGARLAEIAHWRRSQGLK